MQLSKDIFRKLKERVEFLSNFSDAELLVFLKLCKREVFEEGDIIFKENTIGDKMYIILNGTIRISKIIKNNKEEVLAKLGEGVCFGEMGVIDQSPRSARATVDDDQAVLLVVNESLLKDSNVNLAFKLYKNFAVMLAGRLRTTNEKLQEITTQGRQSSSQLKDMLKKRMEKGTSLQGVNLSKANLSGLFLPNANLEKSVLNGASFKNAKCKGTNFSKSKFIDSKFNSMRIENTDFTNADFTASFFKEVTFENCQFSGAEFNNADMDDELAGTFIKLSAKGAPNETVSAKPIQKKSKR